MYNKKVLFFLILFVLSIPFFTFGDTGTYKILDYVVRLTPYSNGTVEIEYYQKWLVTGGHIPWITIGTANRNFKINASKIRGNIKSISSYNSNNWSGVRIDLDRDYLPGETFEVGFSINQNRLFYADENNYKLDFTPGWYNRAITGRLLIIINIFAPIEQIKSSPQPTKIEGEELIWEVFNLGRGEKFPVSISFPKNYMPNINSNALRSRSAGGRGVFWSEAFPFIFIFFIIFIIILIIAKRGKYSGGRIYVGGVGGGRGGRSTGGGGGFGGRASSCACACVSCACACACAGGGGAGCTKKTIHSCIICYTKEEH